MLLNILWQAVCEKIWNVIHTRRSSKFVVGWGMFAVLIVMAPRPEAINAITACLLTASPPQSSIPTHTHNFWSHKDPFSSPIMDPPISPSWFWGGRYRLCARKYWVMRELFPQGKTTFLQGGMIISRFAGGCNGLCRTFCFWTLRSGAGVSSLLPQSKFWGRKGWKSRN